MLLFGYDQREREREVINAEVRHRESAKGGRRTLALVLLVPSNIFRDLKCYLSCVLLCERGLCEFDCLLESVNLINLATVLFVGVSNLV